MIPSPPAPAPPQELVLQVASAMIASYESLRLEAYKDSNGVPTIGYGSTRIEGKPVEMGQTITQEDATKALEDYLRPLLPKVAGRPLFEQVAWLDFAYNAGVGALARVMESESLPDGDAMKVSITDYDHIHVHGVEVKNEDLWRRREVERVMIAGARQEALGFAPPKAQKQLKLKESE